MMRDQLERDWCIGREALLRHMCPSCGGYVYAPVDAVYCAVYAEYPHSDLSDR